MLLGKKLEMVTLPLEEGNIPGTVIEAGPCFVVQKKTKEKEGYSALQLGYLEVKEKRLNKPRLGHLKKAGLPPLKYLKEFKVDNIEDYKIGQKIDVSIFKEGDYVDITGISKGKGFQGVIKRHGFSGGPASHGSMFHRRPGSIGRSTDPGRVVKGTKLPGRMGNKKVTVFNLKILRIYPDKNILIVKGAVPGRRGSLLIIKRALKKKK
jgi:large subunit ribosomal protein L3